MEDEQLRLLDSNELTFSCCKNGFNCDKTDFYHFINFIHAPSQHSNVLTKIDDRCCVFFEKNILSDKPLFRKSYKELDDEEKKQIIEYFPKVLTQLKELQEAYVDKCVNYDNLLIKFEEVTFVHGEKEALDTGYLTLLKLYPSHKLSETKVGNDYHFRLAESQFYRLIYGSDFKTPNLPKEVSYKVSYVDYVVNSKILENFNKYKLFLQRNRGSEYCKMILGFHGTDESSIESICQKGFLDPTHRDFRQSTDSGYYGRGIYFSQYPTYAMQYIRGCSTLLLCQVLLGRVFCCDNVKHGQSCEPGYDSHCSPNASELVVFCSDQILPRYVVHFENVVNQVDVVKYQPALLKYNSKFEIESKDCINTGSNRAEKRKAVDVNISDILESSKRIKPSKLLENVHIYAHSPSWSEDVIIQLKTLLSNHGAVIDDVKFTIFATDEDNVKSMGQSYRMAVEKNIQCILITSLLKMLNNGKQLNESIDDFIRDNNSIFK